MIITRVSGSCWLAVTVEVVGKLLKELESIGLLEKENELDGTYKVLSAFHYMEDLVDCITISEEVQDEIPE